MSFYFHPVIEIGISLFENYLIILVINKFLTSKSYLNQCVFIILFSMLSIMVNTMQDTVLFIIPILTLILYVEYNYLGSRYYKMFVAVLTFLINVYLSLTIMAYLYVVIPDLMEAYFLNDSRFYLVCVLFAKVVFVMGAFLIRKLIHIMKHTKERVVLLVVTLFMMSAFYYLYLFSNRLLNSLHAFLLLLLQVFIYLTIMYIYYRYLLELVEKEKRLMYIKSMRQEHTLYELNQKVIHDLKHQVLNLRVCIEAKDYALANDILNGLEEVNIPQSIQTPSIALNTLINHKLYIAHCSQIHVQCLIEHDLDFVEEDDLIVMLGSLFDYAMEILQMHNKKRTMKLEIVNTSMGAKIRITCFNVSDASIRKLETRNLDTLIQKYHGYLKCSNENRNYLIKVILTKENE